MGNYALFRPRDRENNFILSVAMTTVKMLFFVVLLIGVAALGLGIGVGKAWVDTALLENIFPVTEATAETWRRLCNARMRGVDCAATQTAADEKEILASGGAYFVHSAGELLGIGWMKDTELLAVCSVKPGAGERVMHTLMSLVEGAGMTLNVASTNEKAIRLYEKLGFLRTSEKVRWYRVG